MAVIEKDLGPVSAYAVAVAHGYTGTEAEWEALIANSAINAQSAGASATAAAASAQEAAQQKTQAQAQAAAALAHAQDASRFSQTAGQANSYAQMASSNAAHSATNASNAQTAAEAAQAAAEAAVTGAEAAQTAAEAAVTDAQTAKTAAETAAATAAAAYGTDLLADDYSTSKTYAVGDYVIYSGNLYRCTTAIATAESWTAAHWTQAQVGPDLNDLKSAIKNTGYFPDLRNGTPTNIYNAQQVSVSQIIPFGDSDSVTILLNKAVSATGNYWRLVCDTFTVDSGKPEDNANNRVSTNQLIDNKTRITVYKGYFDSTAIGFAFSIAEKTADNGTVTHRVSDFSAGDIVIVRDYTYFGAVESQIATAQTTLQGNIDAVDYKVDRVQEDFDGAIVAYTNLIEDETPETGYIYSRTTGNKSANQYGKVYGAIPVTAGTTYYYRNIYAYFSVFVSGSTVTPLSDDSTSSLSGSYTPVTNGEIRITKHVDDSTSTLFTDSQILYTSGGFSTYYTANNLDTNYVVYVGADKQYTRLRDGIAAAVQHKNAVVYVDAGEYDLVTEFAEEIAANLSGVWFGNPLYNGIHIIFRSGAKVICNYTGGVQNITSFFNPFIAILDGNFTLENLDIEVSNVRYCVHDERSSSAYPRTAKYINCRMVMDNTGAVINWYPQCIGGGNGCHDYIDIRGCWFKSKVAETSATPLVSYHNNNSGTTENKSNVNISDCYFADKGTFRVTYSGTATEVSQAMIHNCSLGSALIIGQENPNNPAPENYEMISWMNEIRQ